MIRKSLQKMVWRLVALIAAFALWLLIVGSPPVNRWVTLPIEYAHAPAGLEISSELPRRVDVEVHAPGGRLHRLDLSGRAVVLDLSGVDEPCERTFSIARNQVDLPSGIDIVRLSPSEVRLRFERRVAANVPIHVQFAGKLPEGFRVAASEVRPNQAKVSGPESRVRQVTQVETDPIDLSHAVGTVDLQAQTFLNEPQVRIESGKTVQVRVRVEKAAQP